MNAAGAIVVDNVTHRYGERTAVDALSFTVDPCEIFAILGPNGSGKTTLFRVLSTLIPLQEGSVTIGGRELPAEAAQIRQSLGVVFQAPSLDKKLTVTENLRHQGKLYGLGGAELAKRRNESLEALGLRDRAGDLVETLSGGMRRRVELAKSLLHRPAILLMDEPSTGLDPGARIDLWRYLEQLREEQQMTIVLTTHLLDEADRADRIAIMHAGSLAALDQPQALRATVGGDAITIATENPDELAASIRDRFGFDAAVIGGQVRMEHAAGHELIQQLVEAFPDEVQSITLGKPTLEDVFIDRTGHRFFGDSSGEEGHG